MTRMPALPVVEGATVPPTLHMVWVGSEPPAWVMASYQRWVDFLEASPLDWDVRLWTEKSMRDTPVARSLVIGEAYGLPPRGVADLARLIAVGFYGGLYVDVDMVPLQSFDDMVGRTGGWLTTLPKHKTQRVLCNGVLMFPAGHPFLSDVIEQAQKALERGNKNEHAIAGPPAYRRAQGRHHDVEVDWTLSFDATIAQRRAMTAGTIDIDQLREEHPLQRLTHVGPR
jgi:mannosyltransferase OCH1-like enzyme